MARVARPGRFVVVSHAGVVAANRAVYAAVARDGARVTLVVPARWRDAFAPGGYAAEPDGPLAGSVRRAAVLGIGRPQRHAYLERAGRTLRRLDPDALVIEEEPFSLAAAQWARAARRVGVPYGVQVAETRERALPALVARSRDRVLRDAAFVLARSPLAADRARAWGASGEVAVVPHDVALSEVGETPDGPFTVAYAGRLAEEKGVEDLLVAVRSIDARLVVAGDGPLRAAVSAAGPGVELLGPLAHGAVATVFARAHATCVPSRTTATWEEQFGRVAVESLAAAVPVVATATGSLPWVLSTTGGGVLVPERDPAALAGALGRLRDDPAATRALGLAGREGVVAAFSTGVVAAGLRGLLERVRERRRRA
jgi:glycosyltransferase involved in cell wall biosynthesis